MRAQSSRYHWAEGFEKVNSEKFLLFFFPFLNWCTHIDLMSTVWQYIMHLKSYMRLMSRVFPLHISMPSRLTIHREVDMIQTLSEITQKHIHEGLIHILLCSWMMQSFFAVRTSQKLSSSVVQTLFRPLFPALQSSCQCKWWPFP